jgi:phage terminase large subunit
MFQRTTAQYKIAQLKKRVRIVQGGTSSSKTFSILPLLIDYAIKNPMSEISIVAESFPHLKRGALRDFVKIMEWTSNFVPANWNKSSSMYRFANGSYIEFFSSDNANKLRGARRDILFMNECNNQTFEAYQQLSIRTKKFIYLDFNPTAEFWANTELIGRENVDHIILTYKDNEALDQSIVKQIEEARDKAETSDYWRNWWTVYGLGQLGSLDGVVFKDWKQVDNVPADANLLSLGMDFGYSNDPTTIIALYGYNGQRYFEEWLYRKGMVNGDIAAFLKSKNIGKIPIYADSAEPKSIQEIKNYGLNIMGATKGVDSVNYGISLLQEQPFFVTSNSLNLIKELRSYSWQKDKSGKTLNVPIGMYDHCFVGETLITTIDGLKRIDEIKVGTLVLTSKGYKKVLKTFNNGTKIVDKYLIRCGTINISLWVTDEHKIKTGNTWTQVSKLKTGQTVFLHKSSIKKSINYIQKKSIFQGVLIRCTLLFGSSIVEKYLKVFMSTTKIKTRGTTQLKTLKSWKVANTYLSMLRNGMLIIKNTYCSTLKVSGIKQRSGMLQWRVLGGIKSIIKTHLVKSKRLNGLVDIVKNYTNQKEVSQSSVTKIVRQQTGGGELRMVYDIMVEGEHEYFANGILVHNCIDAMRYVSIMQFNNTRPPKKSRFNFYE